MNKKEVEKVLKEGVSKTTTTFNYITLSSPTKTKTAIVVPKKKVKLSTDRNKIKRMIRPVLAKNTKHNNPHYGVLLVKNNILHKNINLDLEIKKIISSN